MKNKLSILASVVLTLFASFMPNNVRADEKAKALLEDLKRTKGNISHAGFVEAAMVFLKNNVFTLGRVHLSPFLRLMGFELEKYPDDEDQADLLKYMIASDLESKWILDISCKLPEDSKFWESLKKNKTIEGLYIEFRSKSELENIGDAISSNTILKRLCIASTTTGPYDYNPVSIIADALMKYNGLMSLSLKNFDLQDLLPLLNRKFPKALDVLDLSTSSVENDRGEAERLRMLETKELFCPQELIVCWGNNMNDQRAFTKELVSRGEGHLETLSILYPQGYTSKFQDEDIVLLTSIIKENHSHQGKLSWIRFFNVDNRNKICDPKVCWEYVSDETKARLAEVLQASPIPGRLELKGLEILGQKDVIDFPVDPKLLEEIRQAKSVDAK